MFMAKNTNTAQKALNNIQDTALQGGIVLMAAASTLGLVEVPHDPDKRTILPTQPAYAVNAEVGNHPTGSNDMRREREETHQHSHTYGVSQRTPGRAGKI